MPGAGVVSPARLPEVGPGIVELLYLALLAVQLGKINGPTIDSRWSSRLESPLADANVADLPGKGDGRPLGPSAAARTS